MTLSVPLQLKGSLRGCGTGSCLISYFETAPHAPAGWFPLSALFLSGLDTVELCSLLRLFVTLLSCRSDTAGAAGKACSMMHLLLGHGAYAPWVRTNIIQAQYFKVGLALAQHLVLQSLHDATKQLCSTLVLYWPSQQEEASAGRNTSA